MHIAYFTNQYPAVSHTFIRREIHALESLGVSVDRFAIRPSVDLIDPDDRAEAQKTRYISQVTAGEVIRCCCTAFFRRPLAVMSAFALAVRTGWRSDRGVLRHIAYVAEAMILAEWCRRAGIRHIHAHFGTNPAAIAMLVSRLSDISYSFTAHGPEEFEKGPWLALDEKLKRSAFAVCVSAFGREQLKRWSGSDQWNKIAVVHCGVDERVLAIASEPPPSTVRFVCVGRLCEEKAQALLIPAAQKLKEAGVRCEIVLVGDGPTRPAIEAAIKRAGLEETFTLTGWASNQRVIAEILAARVLVLPSFAEGLPVVLMEAMALGRPVISTSVAGIPELVENGKTGWLVPAGDENALAEAMREAATAAQTRLAAMGAAGRDYILAQHDALKEARKILGLMERYGAHAA
jgi:colanic acid/amylovoran biosynthesis glycosyltransferase